MNEFVRVRNTAHDLMIRALELLDGIGEDEAAADLQHAIDTLVGASAVPTLEEIEIALEIPEAQRILARMDRRAAFLKT